MNVLIPTDFSKNAWNAVEYALLLMKDVDVHFTLMHVETESNQYSEAVAISEFQPLIPKTVQNNSEKLDSLKKWVLGKYPNSKHSISTTLEANSLIRQVRNHVENQKVDLIIMGTKGISAVPNGPLGRNTTDVITRVKCPVLVIPEGIKYEKPKNIALPTDLNFNMNEGLFKTLKILSDMHNAYMHIVYVGRRNNLMEYQERNKNVLVESLNTVRHRFYQCDSSSIESSLEQLVSIKRINMVAIIAKNLNFFQRILMRPNTGALPFQSQMPFLV
ncbi:MAG: universal stress protein, partial [Flavobacteriaceae bacterium]|nr:universal stress protein [Flavobacteriaceae bacterium]